MSKFIVTLKDLQRHYNLAANYVNIENIIGCYLIGSQNYQLDDEQSDIDTIVLVVPTLRDIALNKKPISKTYIQIMVNILLLKIFVFLLMVLKKVD